MSGKAINEKVCVTCLCYEEDFGEPFADDTCPECITEQEVILGRFDDLVKVWPNLTREQKFQEIEQLYRI